MYASNTEYARTLYSSVGVSVYDGGHLHRIPEGPDRHKNIFF